jgi:soluble lytic murein transglycosylase-like protein
MLRLYRRSRQAILVLYSAVVADRTAAARLVFCFGLMAMLAACANQGPQTNGSQEAARYAARARGNYTPPGPPGDPWGPYIVEASERFDVPQRWIRAVMHQESGGHEYAATGQLITSPVGAMGLMQVMPETYDELHARYDLGDDPYDPHNNILAGAAYMREMYDIYGSPGFLAAYNAGPKRLDDYLSNNRPLPDETRHYVAAIGPNIMDSFPRVHSPAENYAMNALPINIPPGPRYGRTIQLANGRTPGGRAPSRGPVEVAQLPEPPRHGAPPRAELAAYVPPPPPPPPHGGFRLIASANAEPVPMRHGGPSTGGWAIQVGAFTAESQAHAAAAAARGEAQLGGARTVVAGVHQPRGTLYRARLVGVSRESAVEACKKLSRSHTSCIVLSPESQS